MSPVCFFTFLCSKFNEKYGRGHVFHNLLCMETGVVRTVLVCSEQVSSGIPPIELHCDTGLKKYINVVTSVVYYREFLFYYIVCSSSEAEW